MFISLCLFACFLFFFFSFSIILVLWARKFNSLLQHFNLMIKNSLGFQRKEKKNNENKWKTRDTNEYKRCTKLHGIFIGPMTEKWHVHRFLCKWNSLKSINLWSCTGHGYISFSSSIPLSYLHPNPNTEKHGLSLICVSLHLIYRNLHVTGEYFPASE